MIKYRTYFLNKNNIVLYYSHIVSDESTRMHNLNTNNLLWFKIDIANNTYHIVDFSNLEYAANRDQSLLLRLGNKFYILSNGPYRRLATFVNFCTNLYIYNILLL